MTFSRWTDWRARKCRANIVRTGRHVTTSWVSKLRTQISANLTIHPLDDPHGVWVIPTHVKTNDTKKQVEEEEETKKKDLKAPFSCSYLLKGDQNLIFKAWNL